MYQREQVQAWQVQKYMVSAHLPLSNNLTKHTAHVNWRARRFCEVFQVAEEYEPTGMSSTTGFIPYRTNDRSWRVVHAHGYGFCGFRYSVGKPDPWVTCILSNPNWSGEKCLRRNERIQGWKFHWLILFQWTFLNIGLGIVKTVLILYFNTSCTAIYIWWCTAISRTYTISVNQHFWCQWYSYSCCIMHPYNVVVQWPADMVKQTYTGWIVTSVLKGKNNMELRYFQLQTGKILLLHEPILYVKFHLWDLHSGPQN